MTYKERVPEDEINFIKERIVKRGEEFQDWANFLGMSKSFFSHILKQDRPLPDNREVLWNNMLKTLKEENDYERTKK